MKKKTTIIILGEKKEVAKQTKNKRKKTSLAKNTLIKRITKKQTNKTKKATTTTNTFLANIYIYKMIRKKAEQTK